MNKIINLIYIIILLNIIILPRNVIANTDSLAESICSYVSNNNKNALRKTLADNRSRLTTVYPSIKCNNLSILQFAIQRGSNDTADFIIKQLSANTLRENDYLSWANNNGYSESEILNLIKTRINENS